MKQCPKGHYYPDAADECPVCKKDNDAKTVMINSRTPKPEISDENNDDYAKTAIVNKALSPDQNEKLASDSDSKEQKIGKYIIKSMLGQGAMGIVYECFDPLIERTVALKTIRKDMLEKKEADELPVRFKREAQAGGRLNHPNIVAVYEYGEDGNTAFIAMELVRGRELKDFFDKRERFDISEIIRIMSQLLGALSYAHQNGVVHRDIKPANIILTDDGRIKITDFGIAHIESSNLTQAGTVMGTPSYMSPEQFMGQPVDGRSDIFSAGVILYELLTGENPFIGQSMATIMHKVLKTDPIKPSELNVHISSAFDAVIKKAIAKKPNERYQSAEEFFEAVRHAVRSDSVTGDQKTTDEPEPFLEDTVVLYRRHTEPEKNGKHSPAKAPSGFKRKIMKFSLIGIIIAVLPVIILWHFFPEPQTPDTSVNTAHEDSADTKSSEKTSSVAYVKVATNPEGVAIFLNNENFTENTPLDILLKEGEYKGNTPLVLEFDKSGTYELTLKKSGYYDLVTELEIEAGKQIRFEAELVKADE